MFKKQDPNKNPNLMIVDDWDSVVDAYQLDQERGKLAANQSNSLNDNGCMRIIKTKHSKIENDDKVSLVTYSLSIHLMYN